MADPDAYQMAYLRSIGPSLTDFLQSGQPQAPQTDPFADVMASKGISTDPMAQTQRGSQAVLSGLGSAGQFVAQPVLDAAHYADALTRGQENWDTTKALGLGANAAMAALPFGIGRRAAVTAAEEAIPRIANPIRAYHGSPYDFDAFDLSKIGSGEGAQAYGHGLYFAEAEPTAWTYRFNQAPSYFRNGADSFARQAASMASDAGLAGDEAKKYAVDVLHKKALTLPESGRQPWFDAINNYDTLIGSPATPGHMYEVGIHADPEHFLDWDRPLSEQSGPAMLALSDPRIRADISSDMTGGDWYDKFSGLGSERGRLGSNYPATTETLGAAGIPGIRYLDQGSRSAGQGTRNYVVFDPKIIEIMRKYGLLGPIAGAGLMDQSQQSQ